MSVRQKWTCHRNHIGTSIRKRLLTVFWIVEAICRNQRNAQLAHKTFCDKGKSTSRHHRSNGRNARLMPSYPCIDHVCSSTFYVFCKLLYFRPRTSSMHKVKHAETINDKEIWACVLPDLAYNLLRKTNPVFK